MKIIAELCQNHNGDINLVKDMVAQAKYNGADIVRYNQSKLIHSLNEKSMNHLESIRMNIKD